MIFESKGLFIGLVSFPYYKDGGQLFDDVFCPFFKEHRDNHLKKISPDLSDDLYDPAAYRIFGSYSLAVFSLIDDYAFPSRVFNQSHFDIENPGWTQDKIRQVYDDASKCRATVLMGSSSKTGDEDYLLPMAEKTFRAEDNLFPLVGIIRIKVKCECLIGMGSELIESIKEKIRGKAAALNDGVDKMEVIIMDSYDNDELVVSAFSTSFLNLYKLTEYIKCLQEDGKHVIEACHASYGVHSKFDLNDSNVQQFKQWNRQEDRRNFEVSLLVETKPGHQDLFASAFSSEYSETFPRQQVPGVTITGGGVLLYKIPLDKLGWFYDKGRHDWMKQHATRIKIIFNYTGGVNKREVENRPDTSAQAEEEILSLDFIKDVRKELNVLGVSKTVREYVLSLFELYKFCRRSRVQSYYLDGLKEPVRNLLKVVRYLKKTDAPLVEIESKLNEEVSCLKTAIFDRVNNNMGPNSVLEYGCGIQQLLHGFGTVYQQICHILEHNPDKQYSFVVAKSKECSSMTHLELNINHIIYPELFVTTVWKEASNFTFPLFDDFIGHLSGRYGSGFSQVQGNLKLFLRRVRDKRYQDEITSLVKSRFGADVDNQVCQHILNFLHEDKLLLIKYVFSDVLVYHFAFNDNMELMWEFYFKGLLQMSSNYHRLDQPLIKPFAFILMRLYLVALSDKQNREANMRFIADMKTKPFDPILSGFWFLCFDKIETACQCIFEMWNQSVSSDTSSPGHLQIVIAAIIPYFDQNSFSKSGGNEVDKCYSEQKRNRISEYLIKIKNRESVQFKSEMNPKEEVICILNAYVLAIHDLSESGGTTIHHLLRNPETGNIWSEKYENEKIKNASAKILCDPDGGFVVPDANIRESYFAYRTWLYRTLWDLSYRVN